MKIQHIQNQNFGMRIKETPALRDFVTVMKDQGVPNKAITKVFTEIHKMEKDDNFVMSIDKVRDKDGLMNITLSHPNRDDKKVKVMFISGQSIDGDGNIVRCTFVPLKKLWEKIHDHLWDYKIEYPESDCVTIDDHIKYAISK